MSRNSPHWTAGRRCGPGGDGPFRRFWLDGEPPSPPYRPGVTRSQAGAGQVRRPSSGIIHWQSRGDVAGDVHPKARRRRAGAKLASTAAAPDRAGPVSSRSSSSAANAYSQPNVNPRHPGGRPVDGHHDLDVTQRFDRWSSMFWRPGWRARVGDQRMRLPPGGRRAPDRRSRGYRDRSAPRPGRGSPTNRLQPARLAAWGTSAGPRLGALEVSANWARGTDLRPAKAEGDGGIGGVVDGIPERVASAAGDTGFAGDVVIQRTATPFGSSLVHPRRLGVRLDEGCRGSHRGIRHFVHLCGIISWHTEPVVYREARR